MAVMHAEMEDSLREQLVLAQKWGLKRGTLIWIRFFIDCESFAARDVLLSELSDCDACDAQAEYDRAYAPSGFLRPGEYSLIQGQTALFAFDENAVREQLDRVHKVVERVGCRLPFIWHLGESAR
jgi:hypothetical protein